MDLIISQALIRIREKSICFIENDSHVMACWASDVRVTPLLECPICSSYLRVIRRAMDAHKIVEIKVCDIRARWSPCLASPSCNLHLIITWWASCYDHRSSWSSGGRNIQRKTCYCCCWRHIWNRSLAYNQVWTSYSINCRYIIKKLEIKFRRADRSIKVKTRR